MACKIGHIHPDITQYVYPLYRPARSTTFFFICFLLRSAFLSPFFGGYQGRGTDQLECKDRQKQLMATKKVKTVRTWEF